RPFARKYSRQWNASNRSRRKAEQQPVLDRQGSDKRRRPSSKRNQRQHNNRARQRKHNPPRPRTCFRTSQEREPQDHLHPDLLSDGISRKETRSQNIKPRRGHRTRLSIGRSRPDTMANPRHGERRRSSVATRKHRRFNFEETGQHS